MENNDYVTNARPIETRVEGDTLYYETAPFIAEDGVLTITRVGSKKIRIIDLERETSMKQQIEEFGVQK